MKALTTRRTFLSLAAGAAGSVAATWTAFGARKIPPIGMQLYCVRKEMAQNLEKTIADVAALGFEGVEFADYFGRSAQELRRVLDANGLKCCGTHIMLEDMLGDRLAATIDFNRTLGNPYLIVRWLPEARRNSKAAFAETVRVFSDIAARLEPHGLRIGYHNHDYIFERFDGELLWNILADGTPRSVVLQLDTGNAAVSGQNPVQLLKRNEGRTATIHLKPYSKQNPDAFIGDDELPWPTILELCLTVAGTEWFIVEYEQEGIPPLEALKANLERVKRLLA
jgi:sugar phosphate isomerase/epimerase